VVTVGKSAPDMERCKRDTLRFMSESPAEREIRLQGGGGGGVGTRLRVRRGGLLSRLQDLVPARPLVKKKKKNVGVRDGEAKRIMKHRNERRDILLAGRQWLNKSKGCLEIKRNS